MLVIAILPTKDPKSRMTPTCTSCAPPEAFCATPMLADIKRSKMIPFAICIWGAFSDRCNFTLGKEFHLQRDLASKIQFFSLGGGWYNFEARIGEKVKKMK